VEPRGGCRDSTAGESGGRGSSKGQGRRRRKIASNAHESAKDARLATSDNECVFFWQPFNNINCSMH